MHRANVYKKIRTALRTAMCLFFPSSREASVYLAHEYQRMGQAILTKFRLHECDPYNFPFESLLSRRYVHARARVHREFHSTVIPYYITRQIHVSAFPLSLRVAANAEDNPELIFQGRVQLAVRGIQFKKKKKEESTRGLIAGYVIG